MSDFPNPSLLRPRGAYVPGAAYTPGDVVIKDTIAYLCVKPTSDQPGSVIPPLRVQAGAIASSALWRSEGFLQFTSSSSQHGSFEAASARPMRPFFWWPYVPNIPAADALFLVFSDASDASYVADDATFSSNIGVAFVMDKFNSVMKIVSRATHGGSTTTVATASSVTATSYPRFKAVANGSNFDLTMYDAGTSKVTATNVAFPASVIPMVSAWCGGTGGVWTVTEWTDTLVSTDWQRLTP